MGRHTRGHRRGELRQADDDGDERAEGDDQEPQDHTAALKHQTEEKGERGERRDSISAKQNQTSFTDDQLILLFHPSYHQFF